MVGALPNKIFKEDEYQSAIFPALSNVPSVASRCNLTLTCFACLFFCPRLSSKSNIALASRSRPWNNIAKALLFHSSVCDLRVSTIATTKNRPVAKTIATGRIAKPHLT
jgi:hypothetical protein